MALILIFLYTLFLLLLFSCYHHFNLRRRLGTVPSPRSYPFVGHMLIIKPDIEGFIDQINGMANLFPNFPRMVTFWIGPVPTLMIYSAKLVEPVYTVARHLDKGISYDMLRPWLGNGLLTIPLEQWRPRRKLLTPTFHYDILKGFLYVFNHQAHILVEKIKRITENTGGVINDIAPLITLCTLDIICETSMGKSVNAQQSSNSEYVKAVIRINDIIHRRQKNPLVWPKFTFWLFGDGMEHAWALNILHTFTKKVIAERREMRIQDGTAISAGGRLAFLDLLLEMEEKGELNEDDIQQEVDTFMFEGHDTTSAALVWALFMFGCHANVQQRVYEEINAVCSSLNEVTMDELGRLAYLECCVKEVLRLYPSAPFISRRLGSDIVIGGHHIPANTQVMLNIYLIHRDPEHWADPEIFDPDRFLPSNVKGRHPFAFVPFSAGSRNCIGQRFALLEEKTLLVWILRNFRVESLKRRDQMRAKAELILRPSSEMTIKLTPRIHNN